MVRMIPDRLRADTKSHAEQTLYQAFGEQLLAPFVVFHQVPWQHRDLRSGARDGEADFVIAHPDLGILILEVKGGQIQYDGASDRWFSNQHEINDPFRQARESKHSLLSFLKERSFWRNRWITIGDAVAFPDVVVPQGMLRPDAHRACVLDKTDLNDLSGWVQHAFTHFAGQDATRGAPSRQGIDDLRQLLSPSLDLRPLLGVAIAEESQEFIRLTENQFRLLRFIGRERQAAISGCAGSGKTLLAVEKARRLSQQGLKVLLTCYNVNLAEFLRAELSDHPNIHVAHFHGLCEDLARQASIKPSPRSQRDRAFFDTEAPELLGRAADMLDWRVDALIVDEGQDFQEHWWLALRLLLHDPDHGFFYVFFDDNQNLYRSTSRIPVDTVPFTLDENCRNTQHIHTLVSKFYRGQEPTLSRGPQGRAIERLYYQDQHDLRKQLRKIIHRLISIEGVDPMDIVVLSPHAPETSILWAMGDVGNYRLTEQPGGTSEILCTTIYQFKGLESPVIVLAELDQHVVDDLNSLLYVGASRASSHLVILAQEGVSLEK